MFNLLRDGLLVMANCTEMEAMKYIHDHHCYSLHHAIKYEGYALVPSENRPTEWHPQAL